MFPTRPWTMEWLNTHCAARFGVKPKPDEYKERWRFDDLVNGANASRIIFTNGMRNGWSVGGNKEYLSDSILALNLKTGAHHSDFLRRWVESSTVKTTPANAPKSRERDYLININLFIYFYDKYNYSNSKVTKILPFLFPNNPHTFRYNCLFPQYKNTT
jgi:hypothetical protein